MTQLKECTCKHQYQQSKYGNQRVHNSFKTKGGGIGWRCTVCLSEKGN